LSNREPDKCAGWSWLTFDEIRSRAVFVPLANFLSDAANLARVAALAAAPGGGGA